ncbi:MAG TPA: PspC domain-containing protein [Acidimicrobiales bacterium]|nr:PspC domain-containing protein [Acidimicrobiales bacterium]
MAITTAPRPIIGTPQRPFRRGAENAILGGVCGGLAIRLGIRERTVRVVFSLLALVSGLGLLLYMLLWFTLARSGEDRVIAQRILGRRRELHRTLLGLIVVVVTIIILYHLGIPNLGIYTWPVLLSAVGVVGIWRGSSPDERRHLEDLVKSAPLMRIPAAKSRKNLWLRVLLGSVLILVGLRSLSRLHGVFGGVTPQLFGTLIVIVGVLILLAPWWLETLSELSGERRERVRIEERANVAAHLHDSVLQTLTLIERAAGDETAVMRLARNQERELRQWLFEPNHGANDAATSTYSSLLHGIENEIENDYGVKVELVIVGDGDLDANDALLALIAAGREAAINAAQWSGAGSISIFAEVESTSMTLFVRDLGKGFDVDAVPTDRQGIALSIRQRMAQHGGSASIKSILGAGTEVQLAVPRSS